MRKQISKRLTLLLISLIVIMPVFLNSCKTSPEYTAVPTIQEKPPVRRGFEQPKTVNDLSAMIIYYEEILSFYESWAVYIYELFDQEKPEYLK